MFSRGVVGPHWDLLAHGLQLLSLTAGQQLIPKMVLLSSQGFIYEVIPHAKSPRDVSAKLCSQGIPSGISSSGLVPQFDFVLLISVMTLQIHPFITESRIGPQT